jgi:choline kinase
MPASLRPVREAARASRSIAASPATSSISTTSRASAPKAKRIAAIGKHLADYDAFDTGVFAIGPALFAALNSLPAPSLTEGMRVLATHGTALTVDCSDLDWIDVDDPAALDKAEVWLRAA